MVNEVWLFQHKQVRPGTKTHTIVLQHLEHLRLNAIDADKSPVYVIDVADGGAKYFLIPEAMFNYLNESIIVP